MVRGSHVIQFVSDLREFFPGIPFASTNKIDCHDIVESGVKHHNPNHIIHLITTIKDTTLIWFQDKLSDLIEIQFI